MGSGTSREKEKVGRALSLGSLSPCVSLVLAGSEDILGLWVPQTGSLVGVPYLVVNPTFDVPNPSSVP